MTRFDFVEDDGEDEEDAIIFLARDDEGVPSDLVARTCGSRRLSTHWGAVSVLGGDDIVAPRSRLRSHLWSTWLLLFTPFTPS